MIGSGEMNVDGILDDETPEPLNAKRRMGF